MKKKPDSKGPSDAGISADGWMSGKPKQEPVRSEKPAGLWSTPKSKDRADLPSLKRGEATVSNSGLTAAQRARDFSPSSRDTSPYGPETEAELLFGERNTHDAWTVDRLVRRSTVPPMDRESLEKLLEESAHQSEPPVHRPMRTPLPMVDTDSGLGEALDLVDRSDTADEGMRVSRITADMVEEMDELFSLDEFTGALRLAELILGGDPEHVRARGCAEVCRRRLEQSYTTKIGSLTRVPAHAMGDAEIRWLGLDHRAGFVLSRIDGVASVEELVDICGMSRIEVLKTLIELLNQGAIQIREP